MKDWIFFVCVYNQTMNESYFSSWLWPSKVDLPVDTRLGQTQVSRSVPDVSIQPEV